MDLKRPVLNHPNLKELEITDIEFSLIINKLPSITLIRILCHINTKLYFNQNSINNEILMLNNFFPNIEGKNYLTIHEKIIEILKISSNYFIFETRTILNLIQYIFNSNNKNNRKNLNSFEHLNILQLISYSSKKIFDDNSGIFPKINSNKDQAISIATINIPIKYYLSPPNFTADFIKGYSLFTFLIEHNTLSSHFTEFIDTIGCINKEEYFKKIFSILHNLILNNENNHKSIIKITEVNNSLFLEKLVANEIQKNDPEFNYFKDHPLIEIEPNNFCIIYYPFLVSKLFEVVYFNFGDFLVEKNIFKSILDFKEKIYSKDFFETHLTSKILDSIFLKKSISFNESKILDIIGKSGPDYYIRNGNKICIFEIKDSLFSSKVKYSYNYNLISDEIIKKISNIKPPKGTFQFTKWYNDIFENKFLENLSFKPKIYSVIIVSDKTFTCFGINSYINNIYTDNNINQDKNNQLKLFIIIHIDDLIILTDYFTEKNSRFFDILDSYISYTLKNSKRNNTAQFISFSEYISVYIKNNKIKIKKIPTKLEKIAISLY